MESGAGAGDAGGEMEGGQSEIDPDIEAAAASNEKVELDPSESDAAMANLAGGGGAEAPTGGGGGGGGAAITEKPAPPVPDVSGAEPSAALASVSNLPPAQLLAGLGSVGSAVGNTVAKERAELAANPPQMESPSASPPTGEKSAADKDLPPGKTPKAVEKTPEGQAKPTPQPKPVPLPPPAAAAVPQPQVKGDEQGKLSEGDIKNLQASVNAIPARDPGLQNVSAGTPPQLELQGNADPQKALEQKAKLEKGLTEAQGQGQQDLAQPAGEQEISPKVPKETLRAEGIGGGGAGGAVAAGGGAAGGVAGDEAISIIAQQQQGQQIQAAVAQAQAQMAGKRQEHTAQVAEEKAKSNKEIAKLQQDNAVEQEAQRAKAQTDIGQQRSQWQKEQDTLITKSRQDAEAAISKVGKEVSQEQVKGQSKAAEHIKEGEVKAAEERRKGEEKAAAEKKKGEEQSGGIFGWLADKAKAFFEGIKQAIHAAMEAARAAVKFVIEGAQKLATAAIEAARQVIVGIIKLAGEALIAIGEVMLAAFPEMRERYRNAMKAIVRTAENAVNAIANNLKKGVQVALNLLGKGLDFALGLMEKGLMAAVDIASTGVQAAISTAKAAVEAVGAFSVLAKDIASSPGQWLSNLGSGAQDGVRNHLWGAFQTATQEWFNQKVEGVLGLGMPVWKVLNQGGIKTAEVGKMAWEGIKSAIPPALIQILIEKVISMIVPAAGAVLAIIEGLQAAWGTVSRVIQAFDRFMGFLKAVKTGQSGPQFGAALAAAGVVLIDFVSNWLLKRVRGAASKVAGKIKEIAKKIGRKLKAASKKLGGKFGKVKDKFFGKQKGDKGQGRKTDSKHRDKKDEAKHRKIAQTALGKVDKEDKGQTTKEIIANKKKVAQQEIKANKGKLSKDVNFSIKLINEAQAEKEEKLRWKAAIVPNDTVITIEEDLPASEQDLKKAKAHFGDSEFEPKDMISLLSHVHVNTVKNRMKKWKREDILFEYASHTNDKYKKLSFSSEFKGKGVRPVSPGNRQLYGYINPDKRSAVGIEILSKGLKTDEPEYSEAKKFDLNYHLIKARYICKKSGKVIDFENAILGHKYGASEHWNAEGHKQTRNDNKAWNQKVENYQGPEDKKVSSASGAESARYEKPGPPNKPNSHRMWWDTTHPDYAGK